MNFSVLELLETSHELNVNGIKLSLFGIFFRNDNIDTSICDFLCKVKNVFEKNRLDTKMALILDVDTIEQYFKLLECISKIGNEMAMLKNNIMININSLDDTNVGELFVTPKIDSNNKNNGGESTGSESNGEFSNSNNSNNSNNSDVDKLVFDGKLHCMPVLLNFEKFDTMSFQKLFLSDNCDQSVMYDLTKIEEGKGEGEMSMGNVLRKHFKFGRMSNYYNIFPSLTYCLDSYFSHILVHSANNGNNGNGNRMNRSENQHNTNSNNSNPSSIDYSNNSSNGKDPIAHEMEEKLSKFDQISKAVKKLYVKNDNNIHLINKIALNNDNRFVINRDFGINIFDNINCRDFDPFYNNKSELKKNEITLGWQWEIEDFLSKIACDYERMSDNSQTRVNLHRLFSGNHKHLKQVRSQQQCEIFGLKEKLGILHGNDIVNTSNDCLDNKFNNLRGVNDIVEDNEYDDNRPGVDFDYMHNNNNNNINNTNNTNNIGNSLDSYDIDWDGMNNSTIQLMYQDSENDNSNKFNFNKSTSMFSIIESDLDGSSKHGFGTENDICETNIKVFATMTSHGKTNKENEGYGTQRQRKDK